MKDLFQNLPEWIRPFIDLSMKPWDVFAKLSVFFEQLLESNTKKYPHVVVENSKQVFIGEDCHIEPFVVIKGPVYIGNRVTIRNGAYIREKTILMEDSLVGHCSEVSRSIFFPRAKAPHFNYVGDSILGSDVNLGSHAALTNLRLDKKPIQIKTQGKVIPTSLKKLGSFVGDGATLAGGIRLNPGTIIYPGEKFL